MASLEAGTNLSHYNILRQIGAGGMGEVYLAEDTELERPVALKVLSAAVSTNKDRVQRFVREAKSASALNHPNILTVHQIGQFGDSRFIATEYVAGETLRERMDRVTLKMDETLDISVQIAAALGAAHEARIVHRDIKPENVMIRMDGIVKVLDFGLAKLVDNGFGEADSEAETRVQFETAAGVVLGTVAYMSPEQARGHRVDARSDIFSFGIVLYEMLSGVNPFKGKTAADIIAAVLQREPKKLRVAEDLDRIVRKALKKERSERYRSGAELLQDLKRFQQRLAIDRSAELTLSAISPAKETNNSLAVLPLANAGDEQTEYLSDGITESVINSLAQISGLSVASRNAVFRYKGQEPTAQAVGRQLNVRTVLTGRVRQFGKKLIIAVELTDVDSDTQIWGEQYRRPMADIFDLQEEIASDISEKLKLQLTGEEKKRLVKRYTENAEAYQCYLKGRYFVGSKRTEEWIKKGIEYYQQAIELDPTYALAYSGIADAYAFLASSTGGWSPRDAYPKAKAAAEQALAIDDTLGEAHTSLGFYYLLYGWDFVEAGREFRRAIELSPNYPNAHDGYGFYLKASGRHDEAIRECRRLRELDPLSPFAHVSLGWAYYFARDNDRAIVECKKALELEQTSTFAYRILGFAYLQEGKHNDAVAALKKAVKFSSGGLAFEAHLGYAYAMAGKTAAAMKVLTDLEKIARKSYVSSYYFAVIYLGLGEIDKTFAYLEKAYEERSGFLPFINVEPILDSIRLDPRFTDLQQRVMAAR
jgi:serine/threonine-protein kinase